MTKFFTKSGIVIWKSSQLVASFKYRKGAPRETKVLIEAGSPAWQAVFHQELRDSLIDYLSCENVACTSINKDKGYLWQAIKTLRREKPTHYCYDPRTGSQSFYRSQIDVLILAFCLGLWSITPIVILTDASVRMWRYQAFLLTGLSGVVITFIDSQSMGSLFPHKRIIGPSLPF